MVVHSVLRGERARACAACAKRPIALSAYAVSAIAALLHLRAAWRRRPVPSALGMRLLTYTFVALVVPLAAVTRGQPGARRALWAAALAIFAVSALHLSQLHQGDASWPVELVGHHASLPLAFAILYQDYPFALADLFLKRALTLLALVALAFAASLIVGVHSTRVRRSPLQADPREVGMPGHAVGRDGAALSAAARAHRLVRRRRRAPSARLRASLAIASRARAGQRGHCRRCSTTSASSWRRR